FALDCRSCAGAVRARLGRLQLASRRPCLAGAASGAAAPTGRHLVAFSRNACHLALHLCPVIEAPCREASRSRGRGYARRRQANYAETLEQSIIRLRGARSPARRASQSVAYRETDPSALVIALRSRSGHALDTRALSFPL